MEDSRFYCHESRSFVIYASTLPCFNYAALVLVSWLPYHECTGIRKLHLKWCMRLLKHNSWLFLSLFRDVVLCTTSSLTWPGTQSLALLYFDPNPLGSYVDFVHTRGPGLSSFRLHGVTSTPMIQSPCQLNLLTCQNVWRTETAGTVIRFHQNECSSSIPIHLSDRWFQLGVWQS